MKRKPLEKSLVGMEMEIFYCVSFLLLVELGLETFRCFVLVGKVL